VLTLVIKQYIITIMNIQQYMTPEILGPLTFLSVLFLALLSSIQIKKIQEISESYEHEDEEEVGHKPRIDKPSSGQTWYHRVSFNCPWPVIDEESAPPVRILQVRGDWLQFGVDDIKTTMKIKEFCGLYMRDEFNDVKKSEILIPAKIEEQPVPEKSENVEIPPTPEFNVIKIHGEDFVLTPVEKKND